MFRSAFESAASVMLVVVSAVFSILALLIALGGLVGGIWLGFLGEWKLIGIGIAMGIFMPYGFTIAYLPAMGLGALFQMSFDKGYRKVGLTLGMISNLYTNLIVMAWVLFVFFYFLRSSGYNSSVPYVLWAYSTMIGPLAYMASKDADDAIGTNAALLSAVLGFFILVIGYSFSIQLQYVMISLGIVVILATGVTMTAVLSMLKQTQLDEIAREYARYNE